MRQFLLCLTVTVALLYSSQTTSIAGVISITDDFAAFCSNNTTFTFGSVYFSLTDCGVCTSDGTVSEESNVVPVTSDSLPSAPTTGNNEYTYDGTVKTASAIVGDGETVDWYAKSTGGATISAPSGTNAGSYSAYAEARNTITGCLSTTRTQISLNILKAMLTVTADAKSKVFGEASPSLTFSYSGWQNGDTKADLTKEPSAVSTLTAKSPVANYINDIVLSGGVDENYNFTYVPANFEVTSALLTVKVDSQSKVYGSLNPVLTLSYRGFKNGEAEFVLADMPKVSTSIGTLTPAGVYDDAIVAKGGSAHNYDIEYVPASFEVTEAVLKVVSDSQAKLLCSANAAPDFQNSGLVNGENDSAPGLKPGFTTTITQTIPEGFYADAITPTDRMSSASRGRENDDNRVRWF